MYSVSCFVDGVYPACFIVYALLCVMYSV